MADDKTAAEHAAEVFYPDSPRRNPEALREAFRSGAAWATDPRTPSATVRRVAPDRETLEAEAEKALKPHQFRVVKQERGYSVESPVVGYWDAVHAVAEVASGVLGVPAEHTRRETIARAIRTANDAHVPGDSRWDEALADAVLAVLVPADQVRAETVKELSRRYAAEFDYQHGRGESSAPLSGVTWWLIQRGEEYARKVAGA